MGQGGSIPMVAEFQQAFPDATVLVTAVCDPDSRMHGVDESVHLGDLRKACVAETLLLAGLAELAGDGADPLSLDRAAAGVRRAEQPGTGGAGPRGPRR